MAQIRVSGDRTRVRLRHAPHLTPTRLASLLVAQRAAHRVAEIREILAALPKMHTA